MKLFLPFASKNADEKQSRPNLAHASSGDYYLICDADIQVKPGWAKELVKHFVGNTGVVSATTLITDNDFFASFDLLILVLLFFHVPLALILFLGRIFLQALFFYRLFKRISERPARLGILVYPGFSALLSLCTSIYYLLPSGKEWKARKY